jgi:hypothetical protein
MRNLVESTPNVRVNAGMRLTLPSPSHGELGTRAQLAFRDLGRA